MRKIAVPIMRMLRKYAPNILPIWIGRRDLSREAVADSGGPSSGEGAGPLSMLTCQMLAAVAAEEERSTNASDNANDPVVVAIMIP